MAASAKRRGHEGDQAMETNSVLTATVRDDLVSRKLSLSLCLPLIKSVVETVGAGPRDKSRVDGMLPLGSCMEYRGVKYCGG